MQGKWAIRATALVAALAIASMILADAHHVLAAPIALIRTAGTMWIANASFAFVMHAKLTVLNAITVVAIL